MISSDSRTLFDAHAGKTDLEHRYQFRAGSRSLGQRIVEETTRRQLLDDVAALGDYSAAVARLEFGYTREEAHKRAVRVGQRLFRLLLSEELREFLRSRKLESPTLAVSCADTDLDIPWEMLHDGEEFLALRIAITRRVDAGHAPIPQDRRPTVRLCVLVNPTEDLPDSEVEGEAVEAAFNSGVAALCQRYAIIPHVDVFRGSEVTKERVLFQTLLEAEKPYDIIHFAGHGLARAWSNSGGLTLADGPLKAFEIEGLKGSPFFFAHACSAASSRGVEDPLAGVSTVHGFGSALVRGGASGFLGSIWPVDDGPARIFAELFYERLLHGTTIAEAVRAAREAIVAADPLEIASLGYVLFADPERALAIFEHHGASSAFVNEAGIRRIYELEREYSALELLMVNDLPWVLWPEPALKAWASNLNLSASALERVEAMLLSYREEFRALIRTGLKRFVGIVNARTLRHYLQSLAPAARSEVVADILQFNRLPNFSLVLYDGAEEQIEELELVGRHPDPYDESADMVYVFNKQTRFEAQNLDYCLYLQLIPHLVREYVDRFFAYLKLVLEQYEVSDYRDWIPSDQALPAEVHERTESIIESWFTDREPGIVV